jgi:hypothetical protein
MMRSRDGAGETARRGAGRFKMGFWMFAGVHNSRSAVEKGRENPHGRVVFVTILKGPPVVNRWTVQRQGAGSGWRGLNLVPTSGCQPMQSAAGAGIVGLMSNRSAGRRWGWRLRFGEGCSLTREAASFGDAVHSRSEWTTLRHAPRLASEAAVTGCGGKGAGFEARESHKRLKSASEAPRYCVKR